MRVYKTLYHLFSTTNSNEILISQHKLASLLGISRVTLNQILVNLKKENIIQQDNYKRE
ncbi:helix-turn-helix domain-containing protein [Desulfosporosinus acidiphilus]|uniref:helix-turn-helix domain-containing protein n=1 Tax=Desulfosporosinus acidiphilus TaxID=885581 RepID=UPI003D080774